MRFCVNKLSVHDRGRMHAPSPPPLSLMWISWKQCHWCPTAVNFKQNILTDGQLCTQRTVLMLIRNTNVGSKYIIRHEARTSLLTPIVSSFKCTFSLRTEFTTLHNKQHISVTHICWLDFCTSVVKSGGTDIVHHTILTWSQQTLVYWQKLPIT